MPSKVDLIVIEGPLKGREFTFSERTTAVIGRGLDCNLILPDDEAHRTISRHHCLLDINPPRIRVRDFGSLNGTWVSGRLIGRRAAGQNPDQGAELAQIEYDLKNGDELKLGSTVFSVVLSTGIECAKCKKEIPENAINDSLIQEDLFLCPDCRQDESSVQRAESPPSNSLVCVSCGARLSTRARFDSNVDMLCSKCRGNPVTALKVLLQNAKGGEKRLAALSNLGIIKTLGKGTTGAAFLAKDKSTGGLLALKILLPEMAANEWAKASFLREVENTKVLNHPNVVKLFDSGSFRGIFYYTMEYCSGGSIEDIRIKRGGRIPVGDAVKIILQALNGLEYIHQAEIPQVLLSDGTFGRGKGIVHRDIKPANIFLAVSGKKYTAKVADVGVGKAFDTAGLSGQTMTGTVAGSPVVSPRQQVINFKYAKPDVDVWAMAATLYNLLTGEYPRDFDTDMDPWRIVLETAAVPIRQREPAVPERLAEVIDLALVDNPTITFQSAAEFKGALESVL